MKIQLALALIALCAVLSAESRLLHKLLEKKAIDAEFNAAQQQCETALASSCDLAALNQLAVDLQRFENNPTQAEAQRLVNKYGGLQSFCRKAVALFRCILTIVEGNQCAAYRQYSGIDEHIRDIRTGYNDIVANCQGNFKTVHHVVKSFLQF